jgi:hypothetical protein
MQKEGTDRNLASTPAASPAGEHRHRAKAKEEKAHDQ